MTSITLYEVGGCVRDSLLGIKSKDVDFSCVVEGVDTVEEAYDEMRAEVLRRGGKVYLETPQFYTIRAKVPGLGDVDLVLARHEEGYSDGRHPDFVRPGTLEEDLRRRDFTVNALARGEDGVIIDLFGGVDDLKKRILRPVGVAADRFREDPLRVFRAFRFEITKGLYIWDISAFRMELAGLLLNRAFDSVSTDRIREELDKAFRHDSVGAMLKLSYDYPILLGIMNERKLWLKVTSEAR